MAEKKPLVLFKNYDLYDTEGVSGPAKNGPGKGLYGPDMDKYKSVSDFRRKKRKKNIKKRQFQLIQMFQVLAGEDKNNLTDPYESQGVTPIPYAPAEPAPMGGLLDGTYPRSDLEDKPISNLYYGQLETHFSNDGKTEEIKNSKLDKLIQQIENWLNKLLKK